MRNQFVNIPYSIPSKNRVYSAIRERRILLRMNQIKAVMPPPLRVLPNNQPFSSYNGHTFFDVSFRTALSPFCKCLIIMAFDKGSDLYIPCIFGIGTGKNEHIYCEFLHQVIMLLECNWMPKIGFNFDRQS
ncbi:hypothetical protein HZS_3215 [Henneguya salminicola]|nr:hypothetical protein HZS_3215 [Henneguya salminicola]